MTAAPRSPGVTPREYQPACSGRSTGGTCTVPSALRPSLPRGTWTPIFDMSRWSGSDRTRAGPVEEPWDRSASAGPERAGEERAEGERVGEERAEGERSAGGEPVRAASVTPCAA